MPDNQVSSEKPNEENSTSMSQEMVRCANCGVRLPISESYLIGGKHYCSEHRRHPISSDGIGGNAMALKKCRECSKEISDKATVCPHCGVKISTSSFKTIAVILVAVYLGNLLLSYNDDKKVVQPVNVDPNYQMHFEQARTSKEKAYDEAINDIQKSAIFNQANVETTELISRNGVHFVGWVGKLNTISTSHGGKDVFIVVDSSWGATYKTNDNEPLDSLVYQQVSTLKEGQKVKFSGMLIPAKDNPNHWERSITERGSLYNPEFRVVFDNIERTQATDK